MSPLSGLGDTGANQLAGDESPHFPFQKMKTRGRSIQRGTYPLPARLAKDGSIFVPRTRFRAARGISPIITGLTGLRSLPVLDNRTHPLRENPSLCPLWLSKKSRGPARMFADRAAWDSTFYSLSILE